MDVEDALGRAQLHAHRLCDEAMVKAQGLFAIWDTYNTAENPLRGPLSYSEASISINQMATSVLHETILILVASMDVRGRSTLEKTNRVSFPIVRELLSRPGVMGDVLARADIPIANKQAFDRYCSALDRLDVEQPNRLQRLRHFRDEYLAHHLDFPVGRTPPLMSDITTMLAELSNIAADLQNALYGQHVDWEHRRVQMRESALSLWSLVAKGSGWRGK
ncbi:MAG TPA: hypothetical protein VK533_12630 [Sphingomonas sp.]|uniref:hypothetical protein n=1 Tax=Sphingomonas sp. TaxID=28214 RepID=UPI002BDEBE47|nr:hypothetical protein [Sphingomonas sp.]HMI20383.1 hypothetical protein [Sphingomonas sp.]